MREMLVRLSTTACVVLLGTVAAAAESSTETLKLLGKFRQEFAEITPGVGAFGSDFEMGRAGPAEAEGPPHRVKFAHSFAMARYEVPQNLWQAVMGANPSRWKGPRNAVEMLSYDEAVEFCRKVTEMLRDAELIRRDQIVRLPSEAEWEYAARAGSTTLYSFGDEIERLDDYAWSTRNAAGNDPPVGKKRPNAWNLYDMHGYLWEWCADPWHETYNGAPIDGTPWKVGGDQERRVLRGGSWKDPAERLTSSFRRAAALSLKDDAVGLRCVLAAEK